MYTPKNYILNEVFGKKYIDEPIAKAKEDKDSGVK